MTLTGAGGVGKTRLALEVARALLAEYPDGVRLVELAALNDPSLVARRPRGRFRLPEGAEEEPAEGLAAFLARRRVLLVLDNCEHLIDACAALADGLLRACPSLCVLATSREPLRVPGEVAWRVPSMAASEAVRLFEDRAQSAQPGFALTERNAGAVDEICRRLDGIPLAIELAAAQVRALPVEQIAARLGDRFRLLTGGARTALPRQQTLRATIDWSYALLSEPERALFARLSVFAGGLTLEAGGGGVRGRHLCLSSCSLVDKSLVVAESAGAGCATGCWRRCGSTRRSAWPRPARSTRCATATWLITWLSWNAPMRSMWCPSSSRGRRVSRPSTTTCAAALAWCRANAAESAHAEAWLRISVALAHVMG